MARTVPIPRRVLPRVFLVSVIALRPCVPGGMDGWMWGGPPCGVLRQGPRPLQGSADGQQASPPRRH
ncbi:hypothetical protein E2C01_022082 [Portunus trituberculatus]|uniref:Uncharacterized protein n=1 Tax=Portunus trituberculatus TaxID=210409 RepID=A0A5B7E626_PORTR|nr:hypothetical protein [Portunus trituberculatus]